MCVVGGGFAGFSGGGVGGGGGGGGWGVGVGGLGWGGGGVGVEGQEGPWWGGGVAVVGAGAVGGVAPTYGVFGLNELSGLAARPGNLHLAMLHDTVPQVQIDQALVRNVCRAEEHTSELQSLMRNSYDVVCLNKKRTNTHITYTNV